MTDRKSQNSILLLATLGVYLGLVFAGATPYVLAHAATSKQFDIKDEIERLDELDNQPDDDRSLVSDPVKIYVEDVEFFLTGLDRLRSQGRFDIGVGKFEVEKTSILPFVENNRSGSFTPNKYGNDDPHLRSGLDVFSRDLEFAYSLGGCLLSPQSDPTESVDSPFSTKFDAEAFTVKLSAQKYSHERAVEIDQQVRSALAIYVAQDGYALKKRVAGNTFVRSRGGETMIVTRLPRGSLLTPNV